MAMNEMNAGGQGAAEHDVVDRLRRRRRPRVDRVAELRPRRQPPSHTPERRAHQLQQQRQLPLRGVCDKPILCVNARVRVRTPSTPTSRTSLVSFHASLSSPISHNSISSHFTHLPLVSHRAGLVPHLSCVFSQTHDLSFASPATISRMGMIFLSEADVDVRRILVSSRGNRVKESQIERVAA